MAQTQAILDALTKLSASEVSDNAVTASQSRLVADRKALNDLIDSTFPT